VADLNVSERVRALVEPSLATADLELVDVEVHGSVLKVTIDRRGGVDLDVISQATRVVSDRLDSDPDVVPGRYTLEVSSPGVERTLRTPDHFRRVVGELVAVKTRPGTEGERRWEGVLEEAGDHDVVVAGRTVAYPDIERARTVFVWPAPAPKGSSKPKVRPGGEPISKVRPGGEPISKVRPGGEPISADRSERVSS